MTDSQQQNQSNRGDNQQNRPGSQGYGAAGGSNPTGGFGAGLPGQQEGADAQGYNLYGAQAAHNGAGTDY